MKNIGSEPGLNRGKGERTGIGNSLRTQHTSTEGGGYQEATEESMLGPYALILAPIESPRSPKRIPEGNP
eukprot:4799111-Alexandrium_andersonii.AAC.1